MTVKIEVTDHPINLRTGSNGLNRTWGLTVESTRVGAVWETESDKYAGRIEGVNAQGRTRTYTCPEVAFRQTVIDQLAMMVERIGILTGNATEIARLLTRAGEEGLRLTAEDIEIHGGQCTIDGMPADEWFNDLTAL